MKCLPRSKVPLANGFVLHDWHAEVLAIRSFNRFLIQECRDLVASSRPSSTFIRRRSEHEISDADHQPFAIKGDTRIHMYCSEAPCGDASMELTMAAQEDSTPWSVPLTPSDSLSAGGATESLLHGRGYFSELGAVRRKPARPDAPPTFSKSCSDKLALKQCTSILSSATSLLICPQNAYIHTLILPVSQHSAGACNRAFSPAGRMKVIDDKKWRGGYGFRPFAVRTTSREFRFSRRSAMANKKLAASNISAVWTPALQETLIGGVLQGRKQFDPRGASQICRRQMWRAAVDVVALCGLAGLEGVTVNGSYGIFKERSDFLKERRVVKSEATAEALSRWIRNCGDDRFQLKDI
ncbi:MAG: hypothetical protein M1840_004270 [Geoglossum simile]|nr:MAG: hypothetical protein M1840_004270 [Geoglossum simile]